MTSFAEHALARLARYEADDVQVGAKISRDVLMEVAQRTPSGAETPLAIAAPSLFGSGKDAVLLTNAALYLVAARVSGAWCTSALAVDDLAWVFMSMFGHPTGDMVWGASRILDFAVQSQGDGRLVRYAGSPAVEVRGGRPRRLSSPERPSRSPDGSPSASARRCPSSFVPHLRTCSRGLRGRRAQGWRLAIPPSRTPQNVPGILGAAFET